MSVRRRRARRSWLRRWSGVLLPLFVVGLGGLAGCRDSGPTGLDASDLELVPVRGDGQLAGPGELLPAPLEVLVRRISTGREVADAAVEWEVTEGSGALLSERLTVSDSSGLASVRLTLGPSLGIYRVRARVAGMGGPPAEFEAEAVAAPELLEIPAGVVQAGDTILLRGRNFGTEPDRVVVTFSRVRGRVVESAEDRIRVEVPDCLPSRRVDVRVRLGTEASEARSLDVLADDEILSLAPGQDTLLSVSEGLSCFRLPPLETGRVLLVPHSSGLVAGARYDYSLTLLAGGGGEPASGAPPGPVALSPGGGRPAQGPAGDAQGEWELRLRELEAVALQRSPPGPYGPARAASGRAPSVGERREFRVLNRNSSFDRVTGVLRLVTEHSLVYLDQEAPAGGYSEEDLAALAGEFDDAVYPTVTRVFGTPSDLDGNGRIVILLTPAVNRLTDPGSGSFVGGFFFGLDLLKGQEGSNGGEIFYALVPDPAGRFGPILTRETVLNTIPSILAHEFLHMVHFNQRILVRGADRQEALWLSEALAQMAEDLVGVTFAERFDPERALRYQLGNYSRARRFLLDPAAASLIVTLPPGTLEERGAGWLFLRWLYGQEGGDTLMGALTRTTLTGSENVMAATADPWERLVPEWAGALFFDQVAVPVRRRLRILGLDLRTELSRFDGSFPLSPPTFGGSRLLTGSLWSSSVDFVIVEPRAPEGLAVNLAGPEGSPPEPSAALGLLVVRIR